MEQAVAHVRPGSPACKASLSFIFLLDCGNPARIRSNQEQILSSLEGVARGYYDIPRNQRVEFRKQPTPLLSELSDCYVQRIKKQFLSNRPSILVELHPIRFSDLLIVNAETATPSVGTFQIESIAEISDLGVLVLHLFLSPGLNATPDACIACKDPDNLIATVDIQVTATQPVRLHGAYSISDIARFLAISLLAAWYDDRRRTKTILDSIGTTSLKDIYAATVKAFCSESDPFPECDVFPTIDLEIDIPKAGLATYCKESDRVLRALITDDLNWSRKSDAIVQSVIPDSSFASRDTLAWYVYHMGSVKLYSSDFETPLLHSKMLTHFELGIVLAMKFHLHRIMFRSQSAQTSKWTPKQVAAFRRREVEILQAHYNLDIACKDTTADRIKRFMSILNVDHAYSIVESRLNHMRDELTTRYQEKMSSIQILLTVVFGAFGAARIAYALATRISDHPNNMAMIWWELARTTGWTLVIVLLLLAIIQYIQRTK